MNEVAWLPGYRVLLYLVLRPCMVNLFEAGAPSTGTLEGRRRSSIAAEALDWATASVSGGFDSRWKLGPAEVASVKSVAPIHPTERGRMWEEVCQCVRVSECAKGAEAGSSPEDGVTCGA